MRFSARPLRIPSAKVAELAEQEAQQRVTQARGGYFPRVDISEGWTRGNQPVYAFGSLLNQRRFTEANFAIDALNHPDPISNFRVFTGVQQVIFDGLATSGAVKAAKAGAAASTEQRAMTSHQLAVGVTQAYGQWADGGGPARGGAKHGRRREPRTLKRVQARQEAGFATQADLLAVQVHLAEMKAAEVAASGELNVARAQLNELIGSPLDTAWQTLDRRGAAGRHGRHGRARARGPRGAPRDETGRIAGRGGEGGAPDGASRLDAAGRLPEWLGVQRRAPSGTAPRAGSSAPRFG